MKNRQSSGIALPLALTILALLAMMSLSAAITISKTNNTPTERTRIENKYHGATHSGFERATYEMAVKGTSYTWVNNEVSSFSFVVADAEVFVTIDSIEVDDVKVLPKRAGGAIK